MRNTPLKTRVVIVDDHKLFRKGLAELINNFEGYLVVADLDSSKDFQNELNNGLCVDVALLDISMPETNGYELAAWVREFYSSIRVLAVSMDNSEQSILKMIKAGARGYILKDADPHELQSALEAVVTKGFYHSELIGATLLNDAQREPSVGKASVTGKELEFLKLACSELTYKEIADRMNLSVRTVDGYREALFEKLGVRSRVGLAIYVMKNKIVRF